MYFLSNLHKNSILTGSVDSYCLVCDNYLRSEDEAYVHAEKPIHRKNIDAAMRLEKYKDDQIIKVKKGYYCTFCNSLLSTTTKVGLHVNEIKHQENRRAQMLCRVGDMVVAFDEVAINFEAWHGVMDNTCVICNMEFDEEDNHCNDRSHILKLIQSKCEFGDKYVYRKVDEESFFCLICGNVYSINDKPTHHVNTEHNIHYSSGKELKSKTPINSEPKAKKAKIEPTKNYEKGTDESKSIKTVSVSTSKASTEKAAEKSAGSLPIETKHVDETKPTEIKINEMDNAKNTETKNAKKSDAHAPEKTDTDNVKTKTDESTKTTAESDSNTIKTINSPKLNQFLKENDYIIQDESCELRCVLCDVSYVGEEQMEVHLNDLHHRVMLKKHTETLHKKFVVTTKQNKKEPSENLDKSREKSHVKHPVNLGNNGTENVDNPKDKMYVIQHTSLGNNGTEPKLKPTEKDATINQHNGVKSSPAENPTKEKQQKQDIHANSGIANDKSKILDNVDMLQKNGITVDFTFESARCKQCKKSLQFSYVSLEKHIEKCRKEKTVISNQKGMDTKLKIDDFMRENYMVTVKNESYCNICCIEIKKNLKDLKAHADSATHKANVLSAHKKDQMKKVKKCSEILDIYCRVETNLGSDVILNNNYVLKYYSFHCVTVDLEGWTCVLCNEVFLWNGDQLTQHLNSDEHKKKIADCNVVVSLPSEFVREISADVYHCGYCNIVIDKWPVLQAHFTTPPHVEARNQAVWNFMRWQVVARTAKPMQVGSILNVDFS